MALSDRDRRTLMIGGGVLAVFLVGFLLFTLFTGGAEPSDTITPPPDGSSPSESVGPSPTAPPAAVFAGRDPFSPPAALATPTAGPTASGTFSPTPSGTFSPTPTGSGSPSPTPTQPGGGSSTVVGGRTVVLLDIFSQGGDRMVQVEVNGTVHNVSVGERFGPGRDYMLQSVSGDCARFLFGDEPFTLCVSEEK
jgi:hypothetical protein